jgi:hypothetical protein
LGWKPFGIVEVHWWAFGRSTFGIVIWRCVWFRSWSGGFRTFGFDAVRVFTIEELPGMAGPEFGGFAFFVTVGIGFFGLGGGSCFVVFFEVDDLAGKAREDVEEAGVFEWVLGKLLLYGSG